MLLEVGVMDRQYVVRGWCNGKYLKNTNQTSNYIVIIISLF